MPIDVQFYTLARKPVKSGEKVFADKLAGKPSKGRRWYRLEARPSGVVLFPDGADAFAVLAWARGQGRQLVFDRRWRVFSIGEKLAPVENEDADYLVPNAAAAVDNAIRSYEKGKSGWVVFIPTEKDKEEER